MNRPRCSPFSLLLALLAAGCATVSSRPPKVALSVPSSFGNSVAVKHFRAGQDVLDSPPYRLTTNAPMTEYGGYFSSEHAARNHDHGWRVRVYSRSSPKVTVAYKSAADGFQADLNEEPEFLGWQERSYMYARFERKHFRWGNAVSFFSQSTQDTGIYVPNNGHLQYEVWGTTADGEHTVVASLSVSHPKLANWGPEVRDVPSVMALKQDRDYKRVERCAPDQFEPSLVAFDRMLDTLVVPQSR